MGSTPKHIALIMDGNGRWAKSRLMPRTYGHTRGMERISSIAMRAKSVGAEYLTVYALSSENLIKRPKDELEGLFNLIREYFTNEVEKLYDVGAGIKVIGDLTPLPCDVRELLEAGEKNSPNNATFTLVFAVNYGARGEIARAANAAIERGEKVDEKTFGEFLYTAGIPDPDLIIRTGGETRLSNFLLYQAAYSELYFTKALFPDFTAKHLDKAISDYLKRGRRYGAATENTEKI